MFSIMIIRDIKSEEYHTQPFTVVNEVHAVREFREAILSPKNPSTISKYPEDFTLNKIGEWDPDTGIVKPIQHSIIISGESIAAGKDVKSDTD